MATRKSKGKNIFVFADGAAYNLATFCCRAFRRSSAARWPVAIAPWIVAAALRLVASPPKKILRPMGYTFAKSDFAVSRKGTLNARGVPWPKPPGIRCLPQRELSKNLARRAAWSNPGSVRATIE
jgi:hypothetical protein